MINPTNNILPGGCDQTNMYKKPVTNKSIFGNIFGGMLDSMGWGISKPTSLPPHVMLPKIGQTTNIPHISGNVIGKS